MASWSEAFDHQVSTFAFWDSPRGLRYAEGYLADWEAKKRAFIPLPEQLAANQRDILLHADPIVVDHDMLTLVETAAAQFEVEPLHEDDLYVRIGFVWLPRPIRIHDINGKVVAYRGIAWGPTPIIEKNEDGTVRGEHLDVMLSFYSLTSDRDDYYEDGQMWQRVFNHDLSLMHFLPWRFGEGWDKAEAAAEAERVFSTEHRHRYGDVYDALQFTQALWRIMRQTIAVKTEMRPERSARKRATHAGVPERYVTFITLRRPKRPTSDDHEPEAVEWSHRWLVSGHWRRQWYPSLGLHRQIWVNPYIKGPDDKPLEVRTQRVFSLSR